MSEVAHKRVSILGAALFSIVIACLLMPVGLIVWSALADPPGTGGPNPPVPVVASDPISDTVAATAAEFRVDESGAATYSIPIYGVPGTAGVMPKLSLNYSSQGGYGPLGKGWSIGGLSSITRCRSTREAGDFIVNGVPTDGNPEPIDYSGDRVCLDGQRLITVSNSPACASVAGMGAQQLRTEIESFQRVCAYTPNGGTAGPQFFTVERKDGSISWYGDPVNNEPALPQNGYFNSTAPGKEDFALSWAQTRFQDSTGNYIDFFYYRNASGAIGEHLLKEVHYTGKTKLSGQAVTRNPYARIAFRYSARPATEWIKGYLAGGLLTQAHRLDHIHVCNSISTCDVDEQARHYRLTYASSPSGSDYDTLSSIQECSDNSADAVCLPSTNFTWSTARNEFATAETPGATAFAGADRFEGMKLGDIDGDGRQDIVWLKDSGCATEQVMVAFSDLDANGNQAFSPVSSTAVCTPTELITPPANTADARSLQDSSWQLFDYNGDGRDDLFVAGGGAGGDTWRIYASRGRPTSGQQIFDTGVNLIAGIAIPVDRGTYVRKSNPQLADLNGDGLLDVVYRIRTTGELKARLMQPAGNSYGWGAERSLILPQYPAGNPCASLDNCTSVSYADLNQNIGPFQLHDFNGDARSDLTMLVASSWEYTGDWCGGDSRTPSANNSYNQVVRTQQGTCVGSQGYLAALVVQSINAQSITYAPYAHSPSLPASLILHATSVNEHLADINGDGLTDLIDARHDTWGYHLNTGTGFGPRVFLTTPPNQNQVRVADANGDGRADLLYWIDSGGSKTYVARLGTAGGGFAAQTALQGGNAKLCSGSCNAAEYRPVFADFDGDGTLDFLSLRPQATSQLHVSRAAVGSRWRQRDAITRFGNGLGAVTDLIYRPMTMASLYRRDSLTRNASSAYGRGSAVQDMLAPVYVVAKAASSAPTFADPANMAELYYRYAGAKVQGGGRGYLGFREIVTIDVNRPGGFVTTWTDYYQAFPYVGMPWRTVKRRHGGAYNVSTCAIGPISNGCFADVSDGGFGAPSGTSFSESIQSWEDDTDVAGAAIAEFDPGVQAPVHVRTAGTEEKLRDPFSGGAPQTSRILTTFDYGAYGDVTGTTVDTYTGTSTLVSTITTGNSYADNDVAKWRLGRLTETAVTHERPGSSSVTRRSRFDYAMSGAATGLLLEERSQPGGPVSRDLRKLHSYDQFGNRNQTITCLPSTGTADCNLAALSFHQSTLTGVHRYSRVHYDGAGRYPVKTVEPFWDGTNFVDKVTQEVIWRDIFGNVIEARDVNGIQTSATAGALGRDYFTWTQTESQAPVSDTTSGVRTITTYRWCGAGTNLVTCPTGAKFRQQVLTTEAPTQWTYFDVLGRPVMKASASFNDGISNKDIFATCSTYDAAGKPSAVSNPFFLDGVQGSNGPAVPAGACSDSDRKWTSTTYDVLGRPAQVVGPDNKVVKTVYSGLTTTVLDQRRNPEIPTFQTRNGKGELVSVEDAHGLVTSYAYYADGSLKSVSRNAGRGLVVNSFTNDVLGRKIAQDDPDTGTSTFEYNALGELVAEVDAAGNRTEHWRDARGRVWRKMVYTGTGAHESESRFVFDTAAGGFGQLASEWILGAYPTGTQEPDPLIDFTRLYRYDAMGRPSGTTTMIDGEPYATEASYDARGRVWKARDASGRWVKTDFSNRGFVHKICNSSATDTNAACPADANTYLTSLETDPWGHVTRERRGNSAAMDVTRDYWIETGRIASICAGNAASCNLMDEGYGWDGAGNLSSHQKETRYLETFTYDDLNRLTVSRRTIHNGVTDNTVLQQIQYDALGNICRRLTVGWATRHYTYLGRSGCGLGDAMNSAYGGGTTNAYGAHQAGALVEPVNGHTLSHYYDARGNQTLQDQAGTNADRTMLYSAEGQAYEAATGGQRTRFWYGSDGQRYKRMDGTKKTLYLGNVEIVKDGSVVTTKRTVAGVMLQTIVGATATNHYLFHDQLGNLVRITSAAGTVIDKMDFLALGGRRNVDTQNANGTAPTLTTRGFTGHEMVDGLNLVHMNGRVYDSYQGRFVQPDPLVQAPGDAQSWNAYTYVFNNPLRYTDPTGMMADGLRQFLAVVISTFYFMVTYDPNGTMTIYGMLAAAGVGFVSGYIATGSFQGGVRGAVTAGLTYGVGWAGQGWDTATIVGAQAVTGGIVESLNGGNFGNGFVAAGLTAAVMPHLGKIGNDSARTALGAIVGGTFSELTGGKFANGALSGAIQAAMAGGSTTGEGDELVDPSQQKFVANKHIRKMMRVTEEDGRTVMTLDAELYRHPNIPEQAARDYAASINNDWSRTVANEGHTVEFRMNLRYAGVRSFRSNKSFFLAPCSGNACGAANFGASLYGRTQFYYSDTQFAGTPAHEMGHLLGYRYNTTAVGCRTGCSIMSNARNRIVTDNDLMGIYAGYK